MCHLPRAPFFFIVFFIVSACILLPLFRWRSTRGLTTSGRSSLRRSKSLQGGGKGACVCVCFCLLESPNCILHRTAFGEEIWSDMSTVVVIHTCRLFFRRSQSFRLKRGAVEIANHSKEFATCENSSRRFRNSWRRRPRWRITPKGRPSCTSRTTTYQTSRFEV